MATESEQVEIQLVDGSKIICQSRDDAALILDADRRFYTGNTGRRLPQQTVAAMERAVLHALNSRLYRSTMDKLAQD